MRWWDVSRIRNTTPPRPHVHVAPPPRPTRPQPPPLSCLFELTSDPGHKEHDLDESLTGLSYAATATLAQASEITLAGEIAALAVVARTNEEDHQRANNHYKDH